MINISYPLKLVNNAYRYLLRYGSGATLSKSRAVIVSWFSKEDVADITRDIYAHWVSSKEGRPAALSSLSKCKISILFPVFNVEEKYLSEAIDSIIAQTYKNWELCIVDDGSTKQWIKPTLEKYKALDQRIKVKFSETNNHISITTNSAFEISTGDFVMLMDNDDLIPPHTFNELMLELEKHPDADLIYFDEDKLSVEGERIEPFFKPGPSPEFLMSMMYPTHALYSRDIYEKAGKMRKGYEGSQDYDLCLRVFDATDKIYHIPKILYHWRKIPGSTADSTDSKPYVINAAKKSIEESFTRKGYKAEITGENYPFKADIEIKNNPSVEIIIPTRDRVNLLRKCVSSILDKSTYSNYAIRIVDNGSIEESALNYIASVTEKNSNVTVLSYDQPFNYSAINNFAAQNSSADYILFLNNDTSAIEPRWIEEMLMWAQMDKVGAVGAKLLFPDFTVQHAGVIIGQGPDVHDAHRPVAAHAFYKEREGSLRAFNQLNLVRNYSAVTGACLMINRSKFNEVGGFDEVNLAVNYNDVDLCLKLLEKGYRNVYTAHARLFHYESASRVKEPPKGETMFMRKKWKQYIDNDPYYNPNFARNTVHSYVLPE